MRTFVKGEGPDRKFVMIEVQGRRMAVINGRADGSKKRTEKELASEADAAKAAERMAQEAIARGYAEQEVRAQAGRGRREDAAKRGRGHLQPG